MATSPDGHLKYLEDSGRPRLVCGREAKHTHAHTFGLIDGQSTWGGEAPHLDTKTRVRCHRAKINTGRGRDLICYKSAQRHRTRSSVSRVLSVGHALTRAGPWALSGRPKACAREHPSARRFSSWPAAATARRIHRPLARVFARHGASRAHHLIVWLELNRAGEREHDLAAAAIYCREQCPTWRRSIWKWSECRAAQPATHVGLGGLSLSQADLKSAESAKALAGNRLENASATRPSASCSSLVTRKLCLILADLEFHRSCVSSQSHGEVEERRRQKM